MAKIDDIFSSVFDGPDSLFGQLLGNFDESPVAPPVILIRINNEKLAQLARDGKLELMAGAQMVRVIWE